MNTPFPGKSVADELCPRGFLCHSGGDGLRPDSRCPCQGTERGFLKEGRPFPAHRMRGDETGTVTATRKSQA